MKGACFLVLVAIAWFCALDAAPNGRKSQIRYLNSMPQFGKANFSAVTPQTSVFDQVPQGYLTDYTTIDAQTWNFTSKYTTNVTASSSAVDLDSDSYATVFTCQTSERILKNKLVYDNSRSSSSRTAALRAVNLAQFDYSINVQNDSVTIFTNVSYCAASDYLDVPPGDYYFSWAISNSFKRGVEQHNGNGTGHGGIAPGKAYTVFITPMGYTITLDGKKKTRSVRNELSALRAEAAPQSETVRKEKRREVAAETRREKRHRPGK